MEKNRMDGAISTHALILNRKTSCNIACFHASSVMQMRSALFWYITQGRTVVSYRRLGTAYQSHY